VERKMTEFGEIINGIIMPHLRIDIEKDEKGHETYNIFILRDKYTAIQNFINGEYLVIKNKIDWDLLKLIINIAFSHRVGDVFDYLAVTYPSNDIIETNFPGRLYPSLIKYIRSRSDPIRIFYKKSTRISIIPKSPMEKGVSSTLLLLDVIKNKAIQFKRRVGFKKEKSYELTRDFYREVINDTTHNLLLYDYIQAVKDTMEKKREHERMEEKDIEEMHYRPNPKAIIPKELKNLGIVPCLKGIINDVITNHYVNHEKRLVFQSIAQYFFTDKYLHEHFYKYLEDYDFVKTQTAIEYIKGEKGTRNYPLFPYNCEKIIEKARACPCGKSAADKGCCGRTIYSSFRFPEEMYERFKKRG
jgi:hypothetical protein